MRATQTPPLERIMERVIKHPSGCWEWVGKGRTGLNCEYGGVRLNGKMMSTHRAVWILLKGYVPKDLLHQCKMKLCCNPDHLREGGQRDNVLEAIAERNGKVWGCCSRIGGSNRKIPIEDEQVIERRVGNGEVMKKIAEEYNVTQPCISILVKRVRRKSTNS